MAKHEPDKEESEKKQVKKKTHQNNSLSPNSEKIIDQCESFLKNSSEEGFKALTEECGTIGVGEIVGEVVRGMIYDTRGVTMVIAVAVMISVIIIAMPSFLW